MLACATVPQPPRRPTALAAAVALLAALTAGRRAGCASADYYALLGVPRDADAAAIKKAYKKAALKHHPDKQGGDEDTFKKLVGSPHPIEGLSSPHSAPRSLGTRN